MIKYRCPKCQSDLENDERLANKMDACPSCGHRHQVPNLSRKPDVMKITTIGLGILLGVMFFGGWMYVSSVKTQAQFDARNARSEAKSSIESARTRFELKLAEIKRKSTRTIDELETRKAVEMRYLKRQVLKARSCSDGEEAETKNVQKKVSVSPRPM